MLSGKIIPHLVKKVSWVKWGYVVLICWHLRRWTVRLFSSLLSLAAGQLLVLAHACSLQLSPGFSLEVNLVLQQQGNVFSVI